MANLRLSSDQVSTRRKIMEEVALSVLRVIFFTSPEMMQVVVTFVEKCKNKNTLHLTAISMARIAVMRHGNPLSTHVKRLQELSLEMFIHYAECRVGDSMCGEFARQWCNGKLACPPNMSSAERDCLEKISSYSSPTGFSMAIHGVADDEYSDVALGSLVLCIPLGYCVNLVEKVERIVMKCVFNNRYIWEAYALTTMMLNDERAAHLRTRLTWLIDVQPTLFIQYSVNEMDLMHTEYRERNAYYLLLDHARRLHKTFTAQQMFALSEIAGVKLSDCL